MCVLPELGLFCELERWLLNILKPFCNTAGRKLGFVFAQETTVSLHFWQFWWWNLLAGKCEDLSSLCSLCRQVWPGAGVSIEPRSLCSGRKSVHCSEQFEDVLWASDILLFLQWFLILTLTGPEVTRVLGEAEIIVCVMGWGGCQDKCLNRHFEINFGASWRSGPALKSPVWLLNHNASNQRKYGQRSRISDVGQLPMKILTPFCNSWTILSPQMLRPTVQWE